MRTLTLALLITGALSAQQQPDFFERYDRIQKQNLMPNHIVRTRSAPAIARLTTPPPPVNNTRCSATLTEVPAHSKDTAIARPAPQSPHMPQAQLPAPPCSNQ